MENTGKDKRERKPGKRRNLLLFAACFLIVASVCVGLAVRSVRADEFDGYQTDRNDYEYNILVKPFTGDENGYTIKYSLTWYMFMKKIDEIKCLGNDDIEPTDPLTAKDYPAGAKFHATEDVSRRGEITADGSYEATMVVSAADLIRYVKRYSGLSRGKLRENFTVYFSPVVKATLFHNGTVVKEKNCYTRYDALHAPEELYGSSWSGGTMRTIRDLYNKSVTLHFRSAELGISVVDTTGREISQTGVTVRGLEAYEGFVLYGETIGDSTSPGTLTIEGAPQGYELAGYYFTKNARKTYSL